METPPIYIPVEFTIEADTAHILEAMYALFGEEELDGVLYPSREFDIHKLATCEMLSLDEEAEIVQQHLGQLSEEEMELLKYSKSFEEVPFDPDREYPPDN